MRVVVVHNHYREPGGEDVAVASDIELLERAGHEVVRFEAENPTGAASTALSLVRTTWNGTARRALRRVIAETRPDMVHAHNIWFALGPAVLREPAAAAVPLVVTLHNHRLICLQGNLLRAGRVCEDCVGTHPWRGVLHRCYRDSLSASFASALTMTAHRAVGTWDEVTSFVAPTEFLRGRLIAGGVRAEQIRVRSNHVKDPGHRVDTPAASTTVVYVGRLSYEKGADLLLKAWREAAVGDLELVVVGDGPLRSELENMGIPGVRLLGQIPRARVAELMATARCLVVPSRCYEVQPLVLLEAMAHGLPAVVTDLAALPDLIDHDDGFVIDADAGTSGWAAALGRLRDDRAIDAAGHRARRRYVERHTPEVALATLLDIYADAVSSVEIPPGSTRW